MGEENSDTAESYHSLGATQLSLGDDASALESHQRALEIRRDLFGEEDSDTAESYYSLGKTHYESAQKSFQCALDIRHKLSDKEHSNTAESQLSLDATQQHIANVQSRKRKAN